MKKEIVIPKISKIAKEKIVSKTLILWKKLDIYYCLDYAIEEAFIAGAKRMSNKK